MKRFLIFDAYGTLVELDDFYGRLQRGFAEAGAVLSPETVSKAARAEMHHYVSRTIEARTEADWIALKVECAQVLADEIRKRESSFSLDAKQVLHILEDALVFRVFPEVREVLDKLQANGFKMGVLSNWDFSLHHIFEQMGLSKYFSFVLPSSDVGVQKPAREFFEHALRLARREHGTLKSEDCLYIGDHYDGDVVGAREAGMVPVWQVREERDLPSGEMRDDKHVLRIADLRGLLSLAV